MTSSATEQTDPYQLALFMYLEYDFADMKDESAEVQYSTVHDWSPHLH